MIDPFMRKRAVLKATALGYTKFHEEIAAGTFPKPDGFLGPRSPFWRESTIAAWQAARLAAGATADNTHIKKMAAASVSSRAANLPRRRRTRRSG